jgi:methylenetetrahydrofolate dehydrogenase (NAD+)
MGEPAVKVKADDIAAVFREEIRADVAELKAKGVHPTLVSFLATGDVAAKKYSEWTQKACEADGIKYEVREVSGAHEPHAMQPSGWAHAALRSPACAACTERLFMC